VVSGVPDDCRPARQAAGRSRLEPRPSESGVRIAPPYGRGSAGWLGQVPVTGASQAPLTNGVYKSGPCERVAGRDGRRLTTETRSLPIGLRTCPSHPLAAQLAGLPPLAVKSIRISLGFTAEMV
jgi:hypothetical protein